MKIADLLFPVVLLASACAPPVPPLQESSVNASHLDHLYEEVTLEGNTLGAIWIYCEAPDYHLVGDEDEGFTCVDDVARALVFYCREYKRNPSPEILDKISALSEFVLAMQSENGYFHNFLLPGPEINTTHQNSVAIPGWWTWRAMWALSEVNFVQAEELAGLQSRGRLVIDSLVQKLHLLCISSTDTAVFDGLVVPACFTETLGADQAGVILAGLANHYQVAPSDSLRNLILSMGERVMRMQVGDAESWPYGAFLSWRNYWHAWGNLQAYGLLYSGRILKHEPFIQAGLAEVRHFYPYFLEKNGFAGFKVIVESDSLNILEFNSFPQIAYNVRPMIFASVEAWTITGDTLYLQTAERLAAWLSGSNPAGERMYDPATGRTFDGITSPEEVNRNSGAESTIEALLSLQAIESHGIH